MSVGVQCTCLADQLEVQLKDRSRICRLCGKENFQDDDNDEVAADRWYGCKTSGCDYWVHSQCTGFTFHLAAATIKKKFTALCILKKNKKNSLCCTCCLNYILCHFHQTPCVTIH